MKKYKAIDLFCGAGGLSSGLLKSGFELRLGLDIDDDALKTYKENFHKALIIKSDIKKINGDELLKLSKIKKNDNFLLAGCPPCQGFSNIGKKDPSDSKNQLVFDYIRLINEMEPSFILMENVPGMSTGIGKEIFSRVVSLLKEKYFVQYDVLNAADYGVPQIRKRLVLHGVRHDIYNILYEKYPEKMKDILPKKTHVQDIRNNQKLKEWVSVGKAIGDLPRIEPGESYEDGKIYNHVSRNLSDINLQRLDYIRKHGGSRVCLNESLSLSCHKKITNSYGDTYGVMDDNKPSSTLTGGCTCISKGRYGHPTQNRAISIREAARLQSFSDDFRFVGSLGSMSVQIGNAVPPKLAEASGKKIIKYMHLYDSILRNIKREK